MEKSIEYNIKTEILFVDFRQAFDSIKRSKLTFILKEFQIPGKIRRLVNMTLKRTRISIKTQRGETEEFEIDKGVALPARLFNIALEYIMKNIKKEQSERMVDK